MSREQYVEGRIAFSKRLPASVDQSVSKDVQLLLEKLSNAGFDVKAMDVNIVTKGEDDFAKADQQYPNRRDEYPS